MEQNESGGEHAASIWERQAERVSFEPLKESKHTDVLIIGGGITGVLCAYWLKKAGVDCLLVEADRIGSGITKGTTAKITLGHGLLYDKLIRRFGYDRARLYLQAQRQACELYADLCRTFPCEYEEKDAYVYSLHDRAAIEREADALRRLGVRADVFDELPLPFKVAGAVRVKEQAQFHPLSFLFAIARDLPIYEHTKVLELGQGTAVTQHGTIHCKRMIVATHFPIVNKHGGYFLKMYQHRSYVLALDGAPDVDGMYVDASDKGLSFRMHGNLLLLGGGGHRTGKSGGGWREPEAFAQQHYTNARIVARWATQDCMTLDGVPYIGPYAKGTPDVYVATGFNKWGMTSAMVSAMILSDLIGGKPAPYADVFSPSRSILRPQLAVNAYETLFNLLTPMAPRCPHLGCALKYNAAEHSWDCPCHGSRFAEDGALIDNPATDDLKHRPPT
ncbi:MAG: FAD-dependent oxidoreductase [Clostridia bacterium]|nr:FAD-dependent oxidoreductase [Clostridia bacterium]